MTPPAHGRSTALDLSREEAWIAHVALLRAAEKAVDDGAESPAELELVRRIEDVTPFDEEGLTLLREALVSYLTDAPLRDRAPGRAALRSVDAALDAPPRSA